MTGSRAPLVTVAATLLAAVLLHSAAWSEVGPWPDWPSFYQDFTTWRLDSTRVADVHSLMIERDAGTLVLEEGRLALAVPLGGRTVAAVFEGRGRFGFVPRSEVERQQLRRFYGTTTLNRPFRRLTLIFSDSTLRELTSALSFRQGELGGLAQAWQATLPFLTWRKLKIIRPESMVQMLLDGEDTGYFWAFVADEKSAEPMFFSLVPEDLERVQLDRRPEDDRWGLLTFYRNESVCQFFALGDPDTLRGDSKSPYEARRYALDATLAEDLDLSATADIDIVARDSPHSWLGFGLPKELKLDEVSCSGRPQTFFRETDSPWVWVRLEKPVEPGETRTIRFRYHGRCFERANDWITHDLAYWYPVPIWGIRATWDLTFHYPGVLQLVAAGERVAFESHGAVHSSRWRIDRPVPSASFDINFLRGIRVIGDSLPPVTVWMGHVDRAGEVRDASFASLRDAKDDDRRTARDVAAAIEFFGRQMGPPLAGSLHAVETPMDTYIAYPGLVHMMRQVDRWRPGTENTPDRIRAHEIAHQWFGLGVDPATYHDQWLSEGFANFCAIWYLQAGRHDMRSYLDVLGEWRTRLLENRKFLLGEGQEAGPIWLGRRTNSSTTPDDYNLVIYLKGAWVLHMLRNYLLEENDPEETRFRGMMRDFYARFVGRRAFTEDFRQAVERAAGEDMGWFFDQWVYGTDAPTYRFTYHTEPAPEGRWRVTGRIQQSNVSPGFKMPVLVRVQLGPDRFTRQRIWVQGAETSFELPLLPIKPTNIIFNDLDSVLCEVVK